MADPTPNLELHKKRLQIRLSEMQLQLERMDLREMELADELGKIEANRKATNLEINKLKEQLA